jgi:predicted DNA-binding mobile mystery protein A
VNKREQAQRARQILDRRLGQLPPVSEFEPPASGWVRAIRDALGMSVTELGQRMGVRGATVSEIEANERTGGVRLSTLRRAADAMDCTLVYALVPRASLERTVAERAELVLSAVQQHAEHTMRLEDQESATSQQTRDRQLEGIIMSRHLWSDEWVDG